MAGRQLLEGEKPVSDHAIGEEIELEIGNSPDVNWTLIRVSESDHRQGWRAEITNALNVPITAEIRVPEDVAERPKALVHRQGGWAWPVTVPAHDSAVITYTLKSEGG